MHNARGGRITAMQYMQYFYVDFSDPVFPRVRPWHDGIIQQPCAYREAVDQAVTVLRAHIETLNRTVTRLLGNTETE